MTPKTPKPRKLATEAKPDRTGPGAPPAAQQAIDALGIEAICAAIVNGEPMTDIARSINVSFGSLQTWLETIPERSARAREARRQASRKWDELALSEIRGAGDTFALAKAKEIAHHLRWRASKIAPQDYGDKQAVELTGRDGGPVEVAALSPEARQQRIAELLAKGK